MNLNKAESLAKQIAREAPRAEILGIQDIGGGLFVVQIRDIKTGAEFNVHSVEQWNILRAGFRSAAPEEPATLEEPKARFIIYCTEDQQATFRQAARIMHMGDSEFGRVYLLPLAELVVRANSLDPKDAPPLRGPKRREE